VTFQRPQPGHRRGALQGQLEGVEEIDRLLEQGGEVEADAGEGVGPLSRAGAAADLLLGFGQARVAFGVVVVEGDVAVAEEAQAGWRPGRAVGRFPRAAAPVRP